jgi:nucleotidyltransferase substrate binding protein (TIGR01987 family)
MSNEDIRWQQQFNNYKRAFDKLNEAVQKVDADFSLHIEGTITDDPFLDNIIKDGLIHRFEYTHELAWNVMKDFLEHAGNTSIFGSKDATKEAFAAGLLANGDVWMEMIKSINKTSHTYNQATADEIFLKIARDYHSELKQFKDRMEELRSAV